MSMVGLKVWDRQGQLLTDMTMTYPKLVHEMIVTNDTDITINYTPPKGTTLLVVPVYLNRTDTFSQTATAADEGQYDAYTYNVWQAIIDKTDNGFKLIAKAKSYEQRVPIKIYWGYL